MIKINLRKWHLIIRSVVPAVSLPGPLAFSCLMAVIHLRNPNYNWMLHTLSDFALLKNTSFLETISFCILGTYIVLLALGLYEYIQHKKGTKTASILWAIMGLCFLLIAGFRTNLSGALTPQEVIHLAATVIIAVTFPIASFLMVFSLKADLRWKSLTTYCVIAMTIAIILDVIAVSVPHRFKAQMPGLWERTSALNGLVWFQVFSARLLRVSLLEKNRIFPSRINLKGSKVNFG